ncbi:hypothetical protein LBMAG42_49540 [Deltaproteobacteria bacterium]|nr:hypothetical protein LBMAG42_49540 [Deltaproteobacteria bacterium]
MLTSLLLFLAGCPETEHACTDLAAASVTAHVEDADGNAIADATATFTVDGGAAQDCESFTDGTYVCGWEQTGVIAVTIEKDGFVAATQEVTVGMDADQCHVEQETLNFVLEGLDCTDVEVPAVQVTLSSLDGEVLENPQVWWGFAAADMEPIACDLQGEVWACAPEEVGDLEVSGTASGHTVDFEAVTVVSDEAGCHPVTETVALVVQWGED